LKPELEIHRELSWFQCNRGIAFEWDITKGIHFLFWRAEALYTEPAWRDGYSRFLDRAGAAESTFGQYLYSLRKTIEIMRIPAYVVMGKHMLKMLSPPETSPVRIHGYSALVGTWNAKVPPPGTTDDILKFVCERYETILDPCCGYGNVARAAKRFICSDINRKCIYYISEHHE